MGRTALNVNDSILAGTGTARLTKIGINKHLNLIIMGNYLQTDLNKVRRTHN